MTKSMTGYAREAQKSDQLSLNWELKSLNHRYLDMTLYLPEALRAFEMPMRELIAQQIGRGKLELHCRYQLKTPTAAIAVDEQRVTELINACNQIDMQLGVGQSLNALDVLAYPGIAENVQAEINIDEAELLAGLQQLVNALNKNREAEGNRLQLLVLQRADQISAAVTSIRQRQTAVNQQIENKLMQRLENLKQELEPSRVQQELALIITKLDIAEELDRLDSHLNELQAIFKRKEPIGRRLDFLMQEFQREANTIASKSADAETTLVAVEIKVLVEQMREQVQNIE